MTTKDFVDTYTADCGCTVKIAGVRRKLGERKGIEVSFQRDFFCYRGHRADLLDLDSFQRHNREPRAPTNGRRPSGDNCPEGVPF